MMPIHSYTDCGYVRRISSNTGGSLLMKGRTAKAMERFVNVCDEVTERPVRVKMEEERLERSGWIANS